MWIARDKTGGLCLYWEKPQKTGGDEWQVTVPEEGYGFVWGSGYLDIDPSLFPDLKWEDEPKEVSLVDKDLVISWFESIKSNLEAKFPTRFTEPLEGKRGSELDAVNDEIARCSRCVEFIKKYL